MLGKHPAVEGKGNSVAQSSILPYVTKGRVLRKLDLDRLPTWAVFKPEQLPQWAFVYQDSCTTFAAVQPELLSYLCSCPTWTVIACQLHARVVVTWAVVLAPQIQWRQIGVEGVIKVVVWAWMGGWVFGELESNANLNSSSSFSWSWNWANQVKVEV